jgi:hypothetical protein
MKKAVIFFYLVLLTILANSETQPFIGNRLFVSPDKQDTLKIILRHDSIIFYANHPLSLRGFKSFGGYAGYGIIIRNDSVIFDSTKVATLKALSDSIANNTLMANEGLTKTGETINLGGNYTSSVYINSTNGSNMTIKSTHEEHARINSSLIINPYSIQLGNANGNYLTPNPGVGAVGVNNNKPYFVWSDIIGDVFKYKYAYFDSSAFRYLEDYKLSYTDRSLPDWGNVKSLISDSISTYKQKSDTLDPTGYARNWQLDAKEDKTTGSFIKLNQEFYSGSAMTSLNGNVYAAVNGGDIYMQTGGAGDFVALNQTSRAWSSMTSENGNVYAAVNGGDIYMQTGGTGSFIALNQTSRGWSSMASENGNVYAYSETNDNIYMQTAGTGNFVSIGQTVDGGVVAMTSANCNVYAAASYGDIYMQTGGTGSFVALNQTSRGWSSMTSENGNVYATVFDGDIYMQKAGTGDFVALNQTSRMWSDITSSNGSVYVYVSSSGEIYKQTFDISKPRCFAAKLTDGAPTIVQINNATNMNPPSAGIGWNAIIKDTDGTALLYKVESDGTYWNYVALTRAQ